MDKIRSKDWYRKQYPSVNKWINQCVICQEEGFKPELLLNDLGTFGSNIISNWNELELNDLKMCSNCETMSKQR